MRLARDKKKQLIQRVKKSTDKVPEEAQTLDLLDKDFQWTIYNIFKALKEIMCKELN